MTAPPFTSTNPSGLPRRPAQPGGGPAAHATTSRPSGWRRRPVLAGAGAGAVLLLGTMAAVILPDELSSPSPTVCGADAAQSAALKGLAQYTKWLRTNHVAGFVGEIGWPADGPDAARWQALGQTWFTAADRAGLPVTSWAAARWPSTYELRLYSAAPGKTKIGIAGPQASVVEKHATSDRYLRGVVVAGGSFGGADFSSSSPGRYGYDYSYENADGYNYLASRGVRLIRLAVAWERVQPVPGGPLAGPELQRIRKAIGAAHTAGQVVVLDLHGYGQYALGTATGRKVLTLGSPELPGSALADVWQKLVTATDGTPGLLGYDLLNEPLHLGARGGDGARMWEAISQQAVMAVRSAGSKKPVFVAGYGQPDPGRWDNIHPKAWIQDPLGKVAYETHVYFDVDNSGHYEQDYDTAAATALAIHKPTACSDFPDVSAEQMKVLGSPGSLVDPVGGSWWSRLTNPVTRFFGGGS